MRSTRRTAGLAGTLGLMAVISAIGAGPVFVGAADHLDAPTAKASPRIDITDIYAFKAGAGTTLVLNVNPLKSPADSKIARFSTSALYQFKIDVTGDAVADIAYRVRFSNTRFAADGTVFQTYNIRRSTGAAARRDEWSGIVIGSGATTGYRRAVRTGSLALGTRAFAGVRDDPFFFDLVGFNQFKSELLKGNTTLVGAGSLLGGFTGTDTFAGTNISSLALWIPDRYLGGTGRNIGVWGTTSFRSSTGWYQVERMGRPAINTVFNGLHVPLSSKLNNAEKEAFNRLSPRNDRAVTSDNVAAVLNAIGNVLTANAGPGVPAAYTPAQVSAITKVLLPDVLTFKVGSSAGFLNGRKLADDVINAEFGLLTNGAVTSDGVNANDKSFIGTFPYLAGGH